MTEPTPPEPEDVLILTDRDLFAEPRLELVPEPLQEPVVVSHPHPGVWGALLWILGVLAVQVVGAVLGAVLFAGDALQAMLDSDDFTLPPFTSEQFVQIIATAQTVLLLSCLGAVVLLFRGKLWRRIPMSPLALRHVGVILLLVLPLALVGGYLQQQVIEALQALSPQEEPEAPEVSELMEHFQRLTKSTSLPMVIYILAVTPAIAEELIFRGIIGRGLLARYGVVGGIVLTSLLFGLTHMNLPQSVGVVPIGIAMHVAYLATRSFWAPLAMHFLNNALSAVLLRLSPDVGAGEAANLAEATLPWYVALAALAAVVTLVALLWQTRVVYRRPDGSPLEPHFPTVEPPPAQVESVRELHSPPAWLLIAGVCAFAAFIGLLILSGPA